MMDFAGVPTGSLDNGLIQLEFLKQDALRLIGLSAFGSPNLLAELPEVGWDTPHGFYRLFGGHRLWVAPETMEITYLTEPAEIMVQPISEGIRLVQPLDPRCGLQKTIEIHLDPGQARFTLRHILSNEGPATHEVSAWGITQFSLGGIAALHQPTTPTDPGGYLPNRSLTLWPYTRLNDPRLRWLENYLMIHADVVQHPCKVGYAHPSGWGAYLHHGVLVCKKVQIQAAATYPDMNSPMEMYINHSFFELESLSPLVTLEAGDQIVHEEQYLLFPAQNVTDEQSLAAFLDSLLPILS